MNRSQFKSLLQIATRDIMFDFYGNVYTQIEDVAMGSPCPTET